jgi:membrane protein implicated in regulation of membrane protease activity
MRVFGRYLLFQIPGWLLAAIILICLHRWVNFPLWAASGLFLLVVLKDLILYPFLRFAYSSTAKGGVEQLIGQSGIASENINPQGYVQVRGELWKAKLAPGTQPIPQGSRVRVQSTQGMTLVVTQESPLSKL